ncbi:MAG: hypothetical protein ACKOI0_04060 [Actinomycetota bacterium]
MNDESLDRANALLAAIASRVGVGAVFTGSPADLGRATGIQDPLAVARAMRALLSRGRLRGADGGYALVDATPVVAGEKATVVRRRERPAAEPTPRPGTPRSAEGLSHADIGRETVDRLIQLGREVAELRAEVRGAREEARTERAARLDAARRAETATGRVRELESRAEMAESNLRTLLATARGSGKDQPVATGEMEAILGVLKGERAPGA